MATITEAKFSEAFNLTGTTYGTNSISPFLDDLQTTYYLKRDMQVAAAQASKVFDFTPYNVVGVMLKLGEDTGETVFLDNDDAGATSADTPVVPDTSGPGNQTTPYFYAMQPVSGGQILYWVHESELLAKADAKTYFANQVGNL